MTRTRRIDSSIPAATIAQRLASLSVTQLMVAARALAIQPDADFAATAVLAELESRIPGSSFEAFVAEIYA